MIDQINYSRIEKAIGYITQNFTKQPSLDEIAAFVNMSPFHFQRIFTEWAGVSPKSFLQHFTLEKAKSLIHKNTSLIEVTDTLGLSSSSRLHDLFIKIEAMTPAEYGNNGALLAIEYNTYETLFGPILIANTPRGICYMAFFESENDTFKHLQAKFSQAKFVKKINPIHQDALNFINKKIQPNQPFAMHIKGTEFQLKVWQALLMLPQGNLSTYGQLAANMGQAKAARAIGTAIGSNPIAYLIPCHRVIQATGHIGGYMWGPNKKATILACEMQ